MTTPAKLWRENRGLLLFAVLMIVLRSAVADWNSVPTGSMQPAIVEGDRIFVNKAAYDLRVPLTHLSVFKLGDPQRGDIVVFDSRAAGLRLVKRVIGLPGETVEMRDNRLTIDGVDAGYSRIEHDGGAVFATESVRGATQRVRWAPARGAGLASFGPVRVPAGHYLVLGDNRDDSADSRVHGFVPRAEIVGRSRTVVLSLDYDRRYRPRADRFFLGL